MTVSHMERWSIGSHFIRRCPVSFFVRFSSEDETISLSGGWAIHLLVLDVLCEGKQNDVGGDILLLVRIDAHVRSDLCGGFVSKHI